MNMKKLILLGIIACGVMTGLAGCSIIDQAINDNTSKAEDKKTEENKDIVTDDSESDKKELSVGTFIPNGEYEVEYDATDLVSSKNYIKGDGTSYQTIGTNGKGSFVDVYTIKDDGLYRSYYCDLTEEAFSDIEKIDYLDKRDDLKENILIKGPLTVGTRWDTKEIVEVGENLKLDNVTLEGAYIKVWEKQKSDEGNEIVQVHYYSEGLGCVEYRILVDGTVTEHSTLKSVIKK